MDGPSVKPRRSRRLLIWIVAGVLIAGGVVTGLMMARTADGKGKKKNDKDAPVAAPVEISEVRRGAIATFLQTTSTLEARNAATLVARRQGEVVVIAAEEGQWVKKGQLLARLDDTEARLAVERNEVAAQIAKREMERGHQLHQQGYLSQRERDDLDWKHRNADVALNEARYGLAQTRLVAPFSGRITERRINLGETVTQGKECFRLEDFDPILARVYFPERELARVRIGQPAAITLDSHPGREFSAQVALVNPVVDRSNGTFKVTLEVRDPSGTLRPGNFARVRIRTGNFQDAIVLPRRAMVTEDGEDYVFVAHGDTVARVRISVGAISGDTAQILAGLLPGDSVITVGQGGLKPGSRIKPVRF
jgi:membrane fusion protein (multidrug efflux system)